MTAIRTGEVFEALAIRAGTFEGVTVGVGRRGRVASLEDVDQQAGGIAIAFGDLEVRFPGFDTGGGEVGQGSQGGAFRLADAGVLEGLEEGGTLQIARSEM